GDVQPGRKHRGNGDGADRLRRKRRRLHRHAGLLARAGRKDHPRDPGRMTMGNPMTLFAMGQRAMSAQLVRMNAAASNLANAGSVAGTEGQAYGPVRAVFAEQLDAATGLSSVHVNGVYRADTPPVRRHEPGHPLADENGDVWVSPVD